MPNPSSYWSINPASRFHFHHWPDGVAVYLEGEGGTYLLNPVAAELLDWLQTGDLSNQELVDKLAEAYPDDTSDDIQRTVESTMNELRSRGFVKREDIHSDSSNDVRNDVYNDE